MAAEDYIDFAAWPDYDEDYDREPIAFQTYCKWCSGLITMTPQPNGKWLPMFRGKVHFCEERRRAQFAADIAAMPDTTLPKCQFCNTAMVYRRVESDPEEGPGPGWVGKQLSCPSCGSTGPVIK